MDDKKRQVYDFFDSLNIDYSVVNHKAIFSEKDSDGMDEKCEGVICKNLFLKDKREETKFYLVSLPLHKRANIKELEKKLGIKKLTFGSKDELFEKLNILPGSVSILNIIDAKDTDVIFLVDSELLKFDKVCFHPNDNTSSISFRSSDLEKILKYFDVEYEFIEM